MTDKTGKDKKEKQEKKEAMPLCVFCDSEIAEGEVVNFCHVCGGKLQDTTPENLLDIKITEEDIESFIFSGSITRTIKLRGGIYIRMRTLSDTETKKCMKKADKEIAKEGELAQDTMQRIRNEHFMNRMLVGIGDQNEDSDEFFKKPSEIGDPLMDILIHKSNLLREALNVALQTDRVTDF